jgi:glycosyltransferase involved in cell wall biosynthesis
LWGQTHRPLEILVSNDGGTAIPPDLQRTETGLETVVLHSATRRGRSAAANAGLRAARGQFIGFLDDDDLLYEAHLEKALALLQSCDKRVGAVYTDLYEAIQVRDTDSPGGYAVKNRSVRYCQVFDRERLFVDNYIPFNAVLFRRSCLERAGFIDESLDLLEDWDFWIRMALNFDFVHLCEITGEYGVREDGSNSTQELRAQLAPARVHVFQKNAPSTLPYLTERLRWARRQSPPSVIATTPERIIWLEDQLAERSREAERMRDRLSRYTNLPMVALFRRIRSSLLHLPQSIDD